MRTKTILIKNPWTHQIIEISPDEVTKERLNLMGIFMDDEIRERLHKELAPCAPGKFFSRYAQIVGPETAGILWFM